VSEIERLKRQIFEKQTLVDRIEAGLDEPEILRQLLGDLKNEIRNLEDARMAELHRRQNIHPDDFA
jgi:hypothetical protein